MMGKFLTVQKNRYSRREQKGLDEFHRSLEPFDTIRPYDIADYQGSITLDAILNYNRRLSPYIPLFTDVEYAEQSCNKGMVAYYDMLPPASNFPVPPEDIGDQFFFANDGGTMELFDYVRPGDILLSKTIDAGIEDISVDGSVLRQFRVWRTCEMFNAEHKLLGRGTYRGRNAFRTYTDISLAPKAQPLAEEASGLIIPREHITTEDEWAYIYNSWENERNRGAKTLFWEDVKEGTYIPEHVEAPLTYMDMMRIYGPDFSSMTDLRTMSQDTFNTLHFQKDHKGAYYPLCGLMFGTRGRPNGRCLMFNNTPRDFIFRMLCSWMGDEGFIRKYGWTFMQAIPEVHIENDGHEVMDKVPGYEGRGCERHGTEGDTAICKGYITKKYIDNGEYLVDLSCWAETFDHEIIGTCPITVRLKSKSEV